MKGILLQADTRGHEAQAAACNRATLLLERGNLEAYCKHESKQTKLDGCLCDGFSLMYPPSSDASSTPKWAALSEQYSPDAWGRAALSIETLKHLWSHPLISTANQVIALLTLD